MAGSLQGGCIADDYDDDVESSSDELYRRKATGNVLAVRPGESVAFLINGRQYAALDWLRAVRLEPKTTSSWSKTSRTRTSGSKSPTAKPTAYLSAKLGRATRQGWWVVVQAQKTAPTGTYWVEGMNKATKSPLMALPVLLKVVSAKEKIETTAQLPTSADVMQLDTSPVGRGDTPYVTTLPLRSDLQAVDSQCQLDPALMGLIAEYGGTIPCDSNVSIAVPSTTTIDNYLPVAGAEAGDTLEIHGHHFPTQAGLRVTLAGQQLAFQSATASRLRLTLPSVATSGALIVRRTNGDILAVLDENYQVSAAYDVQPTLFDGFTGTQTQTSLRLAYQMAMLSWLAYTNNLKATLAGPASASVSDRLGVTALRDIDVTVSSAACGTGAGSLQGEVFEHEASGTIIVALRGSQGTLGLHDWRNDLHGLAYDPPNWPSGSRVHCGFAQYARLAMNELYGELRDHADEGKRIWITGHSLGGSGAMLLAAMLEWEKGLTVDGVYTFGAPGVGSSQFVNAYNAAIPNTHRYETDFDPAVSLAEPDYFRPGNSHLMSTILGEISLYALDGFQFYPGTWQQWYGDINTVHMDYWCRIYGHYDNSTSDDLMATVLVPPGLNGESACNVADF